MSRAQRLGFLAIAAVIAVAAVLLLSGANGDEDAGDEVAATATPTATATPEPGPDAPAATPEPTPTPKPKPPPPPLIGPGKVTELRFTEGEDVVFRVRSDAPDEIHVHGYDVYRDTGSQPARVSFPATITGIFEIELHGTGEQIAELRVDPR